MACRYPHFTYRWAIGAYRSVNITRYINPRMLIIQMGIKTAFENKVSSGFMVPHISIDI